MNAVIALCHFCEQHGPSVMFCCEKGGIPVQPESILESLPELNSPEEVPLATSYSESVMSVDLSKPTSRQGSLESSLCQACKSLGDGHKGFISYDNDAGEIFVSAQHPDNPNVFSKVRQACVRSLSCEVCPGKEGPIFYGDENDGYVLSYTFFIKDSQARGFKRWYSIIVVMMDRIYLIQSWPFLVECIGKIISYLQKCATTVYAVEYAECPHRGIRLKSSVTPQNFRSSRTSHSNARALVVLTGDKDIYSYLHASFTWMMRACKQRWKENISYIPTTLEENPRKTENNRTDYTGSRFHSLRHMRDMMQPHRFRAVVWHLLMGNQVIWHGSKSIVVSAVQILREILPKGSAKTEDWSDECAKDASLIGMPQFTSLNHPWTKEYVAIEVLQRRPTRNQETSMEIRLQSSCTIPDKGPSLLEKLEVALSNENLSNEVVQQCLLCLKQEWINKTKILQKFVMDKRNKEDTASLLQSCLQCNDDDVKMMKFWLQGLH